MDFCLQGSAFVAKKLTIVPRRACVRSPIRHHRVKRGTFYILSCYTIFKLYINEGYTKDIRTINEG